MASVRRFVYWSEAVESAECRGPGQTLNVLTLEVSVTYC